MADKNEINGLALIIVNSEPDFETCKINVCDFVYDKVDNEKQGYMTLAKIKVGDNVYATVTAEFVVSMDYFVYGWAYAYFVRCRIDCTGSGDMYDDINKATVEDINYRLKKCTNNFPKRAADWLIIMPSTLIRIDDGITSISPDLFNLDREIGDIGDFQKSTFNIKPNNEMDLSYAHELYGDLIASEVVIHAQGNNIPNMIVNDFISHNRGCNIIIGSDIKQIGNNAFRSQRGQEIGNKEATDYLQTELSINTAEGLIIGDYAFFRNKITRVNMNTESIKKVGNSAFSECEFDTLNLSYDTDIGDHAFYKCKKLNSINDKNILNGNCGNEIFSLCENMTSLEIGSNAIDNLIENKSNVYNVLKYAGVGDEVKNLVNCKITSNNIMKTYVDDQYIRNDVSNIIINNKVVVIKLDTDSYLICPFVAANNHKCGISYGGICYSMLNWGGVYREAEINTHYGSDHWIVDGESLLNIMNNKNL